MCISCEAVCVSKLSRFLIPPVTTGEEFSLHLAPYLGSSKRNLSYIGLRLLGSPINNVQVALQTFCKSPITLLSYAYVHGS